MRSWTASSTPSSSPTSSTPAPTARQPNSLGARASLPACPDSWQSLPQARPRPWVHVFVLATLLLSLLTPPITTPAQADAFQPGRAWKHLNRQVRFGPRVPNRPGHARCRSYLLARLQSHADSVERQDFVQSVGGRRLRMTNIIARWDGASSENGVLLCAHWDTRPTADQEEDSGRRRRAIPGANDGASGVAVLLELARQFKRQRPPVPVMLVLFDGEDYGPGLDRMFLGSRHFAANLPDDVPKRGILLDMVGDKDLIIPREGHSQRRAPEVLDQVFTIAGRLGYRRHFPNRSGPDIYDDHLPLLNRGLQVVDLIDFNYGPRHAWWHTLADTPNKCSRRSLKVVGDVVREWVYTRR